MIAFWVFIDYLYVKSGQAPDSWTKKADDILLIFPFISLIGGYMLSQGKTELSKIFSSILSAGIFGFTSLALLFTLGIWFHIAIGGYL